VTTHFLPFAGDRVAIIAITRHGIALGGRVVAALPGATLHAPARFHAEAKHAAGAAAHGYEGSTGMHLKALFGQYQALVCIVSLGAVVRLIAPLLADKKSDPAVLVLDEAGRFAIPVLSGHIGGANALAERLAGELGATAVLTTASDARATLSVDLLGREFGWRIEAPKETLTRACAAVVNDEAVAIVQEAGERHWWQRPTPLPANLHLAYDLAAIDPARYAAILWISRRPLPRDAAFAGKLVAYRPPGAAA
jgi:cobalt-precorrin 5A hydrolase